MRCVYSRRAARTLDCQGNGSYAVQFLKSTDVGTRSMMTSSQSLQRSSGRVCEFAISALDEPESKLYIHCAAGVHRAPMMGLAVLRALGYPLEEAMGLIEGRPHVADFADVYVRSVEQFMVSYSQMTPRR